MRMSRFYFGRFTERENVFTFHETNTTMWKISKNGLNNKIK